MSDEYSEQYRSDAGCAGVALAPRKPEGGLIHHSGGGSQYASGAYQPVPDVDGIVCSTSRKGESWDNAVAESFFETLKNQWLRNAEFANRRDTRNAVFEYFEVFYNRQRFHSPNGLRSRADGEGYTYPARDAAAQGRSLRSAPHGS